MEQLQASVANSTDNLSARISNEPQYVGSTIQVNAAGENIENLIGQCVDYPLPSLPFSGFANAVLTGEHLHFQRLNIFVGEHELAGSLFVDKPPNFSKTSGELTLKGPSVNELAGFLGLEYTFLERDYEGSFTLQGTAQELILESLEITVGESDLFDWEGETKGQLDLTLKRNQAELDLGLTIESTRLPVVWFFVGEATPSEDTVFSASFDTRGTSVKSLMGDLNGTITSNGGSGKIQSASMDALFGDFLSSLSRRIIDNKADNRTNLVCSGGGIVFDNGEARLTRAWCYAQTGLTYSLARAWI